MLRRKGSSTLHNGNTCYLQDRKWRHKYMFDCLGVVHYELVTRGPLLNQEFYITLLRF